MKISRTLSWKSTVFKENSITNEIQEQFKDFKDEWSPWFSLTYFHFFPFFRCFPLLQQFWPNFLNSYSILFIIHAMCIFNPCLTSCQFRIHPTWKVVMIVKPGTVSTRRLFDVDDVVTTSRVRTGIGASLLSNFLPSDPKRTQRCFDVYKTSMT